MTTSRNLLRQGAGRQSNLPAQAGGSCQILQSGNAGCEGARVIAVHSLRGGIGSSTLAVNLAVGLAGLWREPSILFDLTMTAGQVALMLNMTLKRTWADVAHFSGSELDIDALTRSSVSHESGLHFVAAPTFPSEAETLPRRPWAQPCNLPNPSMSMS